MTSFNNPLALIDTGFCNLSSVRNALTYLQCDHVVVDSYSENQSTEYSAFILPGVGAFQSAMKSLEERNLKKLIYRLVDQGTRGLGICLGLQLMASWSTEGDGAKVKGLGLFDIGVQKLDPINDTVPHIGWSKTYSNVNQCAEKYDFNNDFYYVHSYVAKPTNEDYVAAYFQHGYAKEVAALSSETLVAVQFHPEKSQSSGLSLLKSFIN